MSGANRLGKKDPKTWAWGLEFTPAPMLTAFVRRRSTEVGERETEFGLNFIYHFGMPAKDQVRHSRVAELRTVSGARHEFVDRENRIILEYRARNQAKDSGGVEPGIRADPEHQTLVDGRSVVTVTVAENGVALAGKEVTWTWIVKGGGLSPQEGKTTATTNNDGVATFEVNNSTSGGIDTYGGHRTIEVTVKVDDVFFGEVSIQFGTPPSSPFFARAEDNKSWADAVAYCTAQGGRLPLLNDSESQSNEQVNGGSSSVEGFGTRESPWPDSTLLPPGNYWTGTTFSPNIYAAWYVFKNEHDVVYWLGGSKSDPNWGGVACVSLP
jgi:hypothetical protein